MKKIFLMLIATVVSFVSFNSCSGDDDNPNNPIVGTWKVMTEDGEDVSAENSHAVIGSNGVIYNYEFEEGNCVIDAFGYTISGNTITTVSSPKN